MTSMVTWRKALLGLALFGAFQFFLFKACTRLDNNTPSPAPCSSLKIRARQQSFADVKTFVLFTGHGRSGHSIVGAMLDAHPEMVVSHEFGIPEHWEEMETIASYEGLSMRNVVLQQLLGSSCYTSMRGNRKAYKDPIKYNYHIPGQWQGSFKERIKVIGNKQGTGTARIMLHDPEFFIRLQKIVGVPLRFIHVVRNPFDNIATIFLRKLNSRFEAENKQVNDTKFLDICMRSFMKKEEGSARIRQKYPFLDVPSHDVVLRTKETLQNICDFLHVTCTADYLDACASIVHGHVSVTRNLVVWTNEQKRWLLNQMQKYSYLKHFTFED